MGSKIPQPPPEGSRGEDQPKSPPPPPKKPTPPEIVRIVEGRTTPSRTKGVHSDDLTVAHMAGYHSRDAEVWLLNDRIKILEANIENERKAVGLRRWGYLRKGDNDEG